MGFPPLKWGKTARRSCDRRHSKHLDDDVGNVHEALSNPQHQQQQSLPILVDDEREPSTPKKEEHSPVGSNSSAHSSSELNQQEDEKEQCTLRIRLKIRAHKKEEEEEEEEEPSMPPKKKVRITEPQQPVNRVSKNKEKKEAASEKKAEVQRIRIPLTMRELQEDLNHETVSHRPRGNKDPLLPGSFLRRVLTPGRYFVWD